ncbi:hypothetical protein HG536_0G01470 [Torulaspora globosa]|uniref:Uncharacterized protein n=1 Tax=Torulaspora globosa TaxID=48254 RepID=A0A7G3ZLA2_9SACH|nr:uncharacterized protein HG536_0G01470 [Torulaspora globosa]QLL34288.1 hypothetical protein HG536_0G01470 [Torulaspora globosa]
MDRTKIISDSQRVATPRRSLDLDSIMVGIEEYLNEIDANEGEEIKVNIVKDEDEDSVSAEKIVEDENEAEIALERETAIRERDHSASARPKKMLSDSEGPFTAANKAEKFESSEEAIRKVENKNSATEDKANTEAETALTKSAGDVIVAETEANTPGKTAGPVSEPVSSKIDARDALDIEPQEQKAQEAAAADAAVEDKEKSPVAQTITESDKDIDAEQMGKADAPNSTASKEQEGGAKDSAAENKPENIVEDEADEYKAELNAEFKSQTVKSVSEISSDAGTKISTEIVKASDIVGDKDEDIAECKDDAVDLPAARDTNSQVSSREVEDAAPIKDLKDEQVEDEPEHNAANLSEKEEHVKTQGPKTPIPELIEQKDRTDDDIEGKLNGSKENAENTTVEPQSILDQETEELLKQLETMEASTTNTATRAEIRAINERQPIYIYTSLAGGGFHMIPRTNRLATILTANRIAFEYRDLGTDAEARSVWRSFAGGRTLPGVVRGRDDVIGNWENVEDANENYALRELLYDSL